MLMNTLIGIVGMCFILAGFFLDEFVKRFNTNTIKYNVINIIGSALLSYYAYSLSSWPFFLLNLVWFVIAVVKIVKITKSR